MSPGSCCAWGPTIRPHCGLSGVGLFIGLVHRSAIGAEGGRPRQSYKELSAFPMEGEQLNILQTVVLTDSLHAAFLRALRFVIAAPFAEAAENEVMVKPHG